MKTQNFSNHVRRHPFYHFFILPVSLVMIVAGMINVFYSPDLQTVLIAFISVFIHLLAFLTREYAKKNQDRIIRLETRLRYWQLTGRSFEEKEKDLSLSQLLALRFAPDRQFLDLLDSPGLKLAAAIDIKKQIREWKPDTMRV